MNFEVGSEYEVSGQRHKLESVEHYRNRRSGRESVVLHWRSACRVCGEPYTWKSGPTARGGTVHCPAHRLAPAEQRLRIAVKAMNTPEAIRKRVATLKLRRLLGKVNAPSAEGTKAEG